MSLTDNEKKVISDEMGWKDQSKLFRVFTNKGGVVYFDLNDAGLVRDWLVERGGSGRTLLIS